MAGCSASDSGILAPCTSPLAAPPVFVDTSLGTHVALVVSPDETVADFKRKVCIEHAACFPSFGEVSVLSMKVRRRAIYYHLSDSMLIRTAFNGIKGTWFVQMDMAPLPKKLDKDESNMKAANTQIPSPSSLLHALLVPSLGQSCIDAHHGEELERERKQLSFDLLDGRQLRDDAPKNAESNVRPSSLSGALLVQTVSGQEELDREMEQSKSGIMNDDQRREDDSQDKESNPKTSSLSGALVSRVGVKTPLPTGAGHGEEELGREIGNLGNLLDANPGLLGGQLNEGGSKEGEPKNAGYAVSFAAEAGAAVLSLEKNTDPGKKRSKKCKEKDDANYSKNEEEASQATIAIENVSSTDAAKGVNQLGILGELCSQLLDEDSLLQHNLLEKKKRKKKRRRDDVEDRSAEEIALSELGSGGKDSSLIEDPVRIVPNEKIPITKESFLVQKSKGLFDGDIDFDSDQKKSRAKNKKVKALSPPVPQIVSDSGKMPEDESHKPVNATESFEPEHDSKPLKNRKRRSEKEEMIPKVSKIVPDTTLPEETALNSPSTKKSDKSLTRSKKKSANVEASLADSVSLLEKPLENVPKLDQSDSRRRSKRRLSNKNSSDLPDKGKEKPILGDNDDASAYNLKKKVHTVKTEKSEARSMRESDDIDKEQSQNSARERTAFPAASGDTTEDDSVYVKKNYRIAVRKNSKIRSNKDVKKSDQEEIFLKAGDDTFDHFAGSSSDDLVEEKESVSCKLEQNYPKEDASPTMVIRGPRAPKSNTHSGASLSTVEVSGEEIDLSQASNTSKKKVALSVLLRGSQSYRKAKHSASVAQTDDADSQPIDFVPETQPEGH